MSDSKDKPKPKTQPDKGSSGKPPRKTRVGTGGGGGGGDFYPGQSIVCKILRKEPRGYEVLLLKSNIRGFLLTELEFQLGNEVIAQFVRWGTERPLLVQYPDLTGKSQSGEKSNSWLVQFPDLTGQSQTREKLTTFLENQKSKKKTTIERAFKPFEFKRAYDVIMPPLEKDSHKSILVGDYEPEWILHDIESRMLTGCLKFDNDIKKSRGSILLNQGKVVGCTFNSTSRPETRPTQESLDYLVQTLKFKDTTLSLYDLPTEIVVPLSSLFLGYPVNRQDYYTSLEYFRYIMDWFENQKSTATIISSLSHERDYCLSFVYRGSYAGTFIVQEQKFEENRDTLEDLLDYYSEQSELEVSVLPPEFDQKNLDLDFHQRNMKRKTNYVYLPLSQSDLDLLRASNFQVFPEGLTVRPMNLSDADEYAQKEIANKGRFDSKSYIAECEVFQDYLSKLSIEMISDIYLSYTIEGDERKRFIDNIVGEIRVSMIFSKLKSKNELMSLIEEFDVNVYSEENLEKLHESFESSGFSSVTFGMLYNEIINIANSFEAMTRQEQASLMVPLFQFIERFGDIEIGTPGALVHALEGFGDSYIPFLRESIKRKPTPTNVDMVSRILNSELTKEERLDYRNLLREAISHRLASAETIEFIEIILLD